MLLRQIHLNFASDSVATTIDCFEEATRWEMIRTDRPNVVAFDRNVTTTKINQSRTLLLPLASLFTLVVAEITGNKSSGYHPFSLL